MTQVHSHPDNEKLHQIAKAIERIKGKGTLPSVRRDSPEWQAWRQWFIERGYLTKWSDNQPADLMMTVVFEYPPADIEELLSKWCRGKGKKVQLEE